MTDFALRFINKATFDAIHRAIYEQTSGRTLAQGEETPTQGLSQTGTQWFVDEIGEMYLQTAGDGPGPPVMTPRDGWHVNLRWNGGDTEPPSNIPGMEIVWRSDAVDGNGGPVPRPEWWSRIIA